jgi:hypothetical protein
MMRVGAVGNRRELMHFQKRGPCTHFAVMLRSASHMSFVAASSIGK